MKHRHDVLLELESMVMEWITSVGRSSGMSEEEAESHGGKIVTLGSYRLGVVHPGSDIDTLCIAPPHVSREAFFGMDPHKPSFVERLKRLDGITECVPVP